MRRGPAQGGASGWPSRGGTGLVGRQVVTALARAEHLPVVLARTAGVDLVSGVGLDDALRGVEAVIDVSNIDTTRRRAAVAFFSTATQNLLAAGARAGVRHHVVLSIVGVDQVGSGYYKGKRAQEDLVFAAPTPSTVLRVTQFHEFVGHFLGKTRGPVVAIPRMRIQPIASAEVASHLVGIVAGPALGGAPDLAGPEEHQLSDLARRLLRAQRKRRYVLDLPLPGSMARAVAQGALVPRAAGPRGRQTFDQ